MQHRTKLLGLIMGVFLLGFIFTSCNSSGDNDRETTTEEIADTQASGDLAATAEADIASTKDDTPVSGKAVFTQEGADRVKLNVTLNIPSKAGREVAVHLHENGDCGDGGMDAKGHWNPTEDQHGQWDSDHFHRGDIGNIKLDSDGNGSLEMTTGLWSVGGDDSVKNVIGKAVIVHDGSDDFVTQPTGDAGGRIGCAVVKQ